MPVTSLRREAVLSGIARRILGLQPEQRVRVAVDGVDGAGKSVFADELAERIESRGRPVVRASVDEFHRPRIERYRRGRTSPEGYYRDSYDYLRLTEVLLGPFAPGGSGRFQVAAFDHRSDAMVVAAERQALPNAVLIFDGIFLHRPQLREHWEFSIFLHVGFDLAVARSAQRDGTSPDPLAVSNRRYVLGQRLYLHEAKPWQRATVVVDNSDLAAPATIEPNGFRPGRL